MSEHIFTETQIREIIEKTQQVAESNGGVIPVSKVEDAASLAAYIAGFSSWKQYRKSCKNESQLSRKMSFKDDVVNKRFEHTSVDITPMSIMNFKNYLKSFKNDKKESSLKENKQLIFKVAVGQSYNKVTKANQVHYLNIENTCFIGEDLNFMECAQTSLKHQQQTVIEFNSDKKGTIKLDPINEIFTSDHLEDFLSDSSNDHKGFAFIWGLLIKQLVQQYKIKFTADFLMETLDLDFVLKYWLTLRQESNFLANVLMNYIKSLSHVNVDSEKINLSKEVQEKHWKNISQIFYQLASLKECYEQNVFSYEGISLIDSMREKESVTISIPPKVNALIYGVLDFLITSAITSYEKQVEEFNIKEHGVFIFNKHESLMKINVVSDYVISFVHAMPHESKRLHFFNQVVFSKHSSFLLPSQEFINKFYINTVKIEENIFNNSGDSLLKLEDKFGYLWTNENKEAEISPFVLQKIMN